MELKTLERQIEKRCPNFKERIKRNECSACGAPLAPDKRSVTFGTRKWDEHTYRPTCKCFTKGIRISVG